MYTHYVHVHVHISHIDHCACSMASSFLYINVRVVHVHAFMYIYVYIYCGSFTVHGSVASLEPSTCTDNSISHTDQCLYVMHVHVHVHACTYIMYVHTLFAPSSLMDKERWGAGVETQKNVRGEIGGWGRVPFNEPYAPLLSTIYDGA